MSTSTAKNPTPVEPRQDLHHEIVKFLIGNRDKLRMNEPLDIAGDVAELAKDILIGAYEIAEFLFGDRNKRRKVFHLAETSRLPVFRLGTVICARRSVLMAWIAEQEQRGQRLTSRR